MCPSSESSKQVFTVLTWLFLRFSPEQTYKNMKSINVKYTFYLYIYSEAKSGLNSSKLIQTMSNTHTQIFTPSLSEKHHPFNI